ncbi:hypothetical protein [Nannocystis punicea]|uniref:Lipoprotein n=1 Tax=Nannocystis punicea TaxID=2995304 RepID=A0ABY7GVI6_9BACT|nr:hypothetical protein [Nannocystis poenicansa]WAS90986.1 hypothetical protein O0S08_32760 [Nannocystis poenicansa]
MLTRAPLFAALALIACSCEAPAPPPASPAPVAAQAREHWLLEPGHHTAVPVTPSLPAELGEVQLRFTQAMAVQQDWLQQYLTELQLPPGARLPYHPNFAITEAEYQKLVHAYENPLFAEGDRHDLEVRIDGDALRFTATGALAPLTQLAIEADGRLRYGELVIDKPERVENLKADFGTWSGFSWRRDASNPSARELDALDFALGRTADRRFLHLSRRRSDGTAMIENIELLAWID